jgi:hypothetical protein
MYKFDVSEPDFIFIADQKTIQQTLGLSPIMARMVQAMLMTTGWISPEDMPELKFSVRQLMYMMRKRLSKHQIVIVNDGVGGYGLTPQSKQIIKRLLEAC